MGGCVTWLLVLAAGVLAIVTLLRWFEQATEAVENRWWNKVIVLIAMPFAVWFFPSRVSAGRPTAVPRHEPVRGFGKVSLNPSEQPAKTQATPTDRPPPGTPKEFIGLPKIPPKIVGAKPAVDPDKIAKLKQKMKEQGMLDENQ
jgi:hypothetical protein